MQGRLTATIVHVFSRDPAIDRTDEAKVAKALKHTRETGELNGLPVKEGKKLALWHINGLSERAYAELTIVRAQAGAAGEGVSYIEARNALRFGLVKVEHAEGVDRRPLQLDFEGDPRVLTVASLDAIFNRFGPKAVQELGARIVELSNLDPL